MECQSNILVSSSVGATLQTETAFSTTRMRARSVRTTYFCIASLSKFRRHSLHSETQGREKGKVPNWDAGALSKSELALA